MIQYSRRLTPWLYALLIAMSLVLILPPAQAATNQEELIRDAREALFNALQIVGFTYR